MGLSRRAYARHRGVAENAVRKAIASGRIELEPDGTIDPDTGEIGAPPRLIDPCALDIPEFLRRTA